MDERVEHVVKLLFDADLEEVPADARETTVEPELKAALTSAGLLTVGRRLAFGVDGSGRKPDDARRVASGGSGPFDLAIEYKLYRTRNQAAGEMDRALGQCIAYAEQYDAVLFFVVYMGSPREQIPERWLDRTNPLRVGHKAPGVPIYFAARPRSWRDDAWAGSFRR